MSKKSKSKIHSVICCFCGMSLNYTDSVQILLNLISNSEVNQTIYGHKKCLEKILHKCVPLHPDILENE